MNHVQIQLLAIAFQRKHSKQPVAGASHAMPGLL